MWDWIELRGLQRAVHLFDTRLVGVNADNAKTVTLPGYAPELNPVEHVWNRLKWADLANATPVDSDELHRQLEPLLQQTADSALRLASFWKGARLPIQKESPPFRQPDAVEFVACLM